MSKKWLSFNREGKMMVLLVKISLSLTTFSQNRASATFLNFLWFEPSPFYKKGPYKKEWVCVFFEKSCNFKKLLKLRRSSIFANSVSVCIFIQPSWAKIWYTWDNLYCTFTQQIRPSLCLWSKGSPNLFREKKIANHLLTFTLSAWVLQNGFWLWQVWEQFLDTIFYSLTWCL